MTGVLIRRDENPGMHRGVTAWGHREEAAAHTPRREASGPARRRLHPRFQPPELGEISFCLSIHPDCGTLLWPPQKTHANLNQSFEPSCVFLHCWGRGVSNTGRQPSSLSGLPAPRRPTTRSAEHQVRAAVLGVTLGRGTCQCWEMGAQRIWGGHTEGGDHRSHKRPRGLRTGVDTRGAPGKLN